MSLQNKFNINIRLLNNNDSLEELTDLIHRAYSQLADMGFRYWGTYQTVEDTQKRISGGECYVVIYENKIIGTIMLALPQRKSCHSWYNRPDVATFHQFAIDPGHQKKGVGSMLLQIIEKRAIQLGATELACDTAEGATHLIQFYIKRGFRQVDNANWDRANYKSVILSKTIA